MSRVERKTSQSADSMFQRVFLKVDNTRVIGKLQRPAGAAPLPVVIVRASVICEVTPDGPATAGLAFRGGFQGLRLMPRPPPRPQL